MQSVNGCLKTKELKLQGSNDIDISLVVEGDSVNVKKGDSVVPLQITSQTFLVTANAGKFELNGIQTKNLHLIRGHLYKFDQTNSLNHPFKISLSQDGTQYTNGWSVDGNILSWIVPYEAPDHMFYYCQNHTGMGSNIYLSNSNGEETFDIKLSVNANTDKIGSDPLDNTYTNLISAINGLVSRVTALEQTP